jgi:hypothetical protein
VSHEENTVWLLAYLQGSLEAFSGSFSLDSKVLIFLAFSIQILLFFLWVKELGKQFSFSVVGGFFILCFTLCFFHNFACLI